jgi:hypothetical protein
MREPRIVRPPRRKVIRVVCAPPPAGAKDHACVASYNGHFWVFTWRDAKGR